MACAFYGRSCRAAPGSSFLLGTVVSCSTRRQAEPAAESESIGCFLPGVFGTIARYVAGNPAGKMLLSTGNLVQGGTAEGLGGNWQ